MKFEIILPVKIKKLKICELINIIDTIQSFDYDWRSYIITITENFSRYKESEKLTPIPTNSGAIDFVEYVYDEEKLLEYLKNRIKGEKFRKLKKLVDLGYDISKLVHEDLLETLIYNYKDIITSVRIEAFIVLKEKIMEDIVEKALIETSFNDYEIFKASYYYLIPKDVYDALERSYYLIDYLSELTRLDKYSSIEGESPILVLRGYYLTKKTMLELEKVLGRVIEKLGDSVECKTLMFNRVF